MVTLVRRPEVTPFAIAKVNEISVKPFSMLSSVDKQGHEDTGSEEEMYKTYSRYYNKQVTPQTEVKIIKFEILNFLD